MLLLEVSSALENAYLIIALLGALVALGTTIWGIIQKIKAGNWKDVAADAQEVGEQLDSLLGHTTNALDRVKVNTAGIVQARDAVRSVLKNTGADLEAAGLKGVMDAKLKELGLDTKS